VALDLALRQRAVAAELESQVATPKVAPAVATAPEAAVPPPETAQPPQSPEIHVDAGGCWLPEWDEDRQQVLASRRTTAHGMKVDPSNAPPLDACHSGPWMVLPLDPIPSSEDALRPFKWVYQALREQRAKGYASAYPHLA